MTPYPSAPDWSGKTILIAENTHSSFTVLSALLKKNKARILRAYDGQEAITLCNKEKNIDIILMDISTPGYDGIEALKKIRQQFPGKTVIAQTAHGLSEMLSEEEFDDFLQKPSRRNQLPEVISKYLS